MKVFRNLLVVALVLCAIIILKAHQALNTPNGMNSSISVVVAKGDTSRHVAKKLEQAGVIKSRLLFQIAARIYRIDKHLKAGEYLFSPNVSMSQVLVIVSKGRVYYRKIILKEGWTTHRMLEEIKKNENLTGEISVLISEGDLLPETYSFSRGDSRDSIIIHAKSAMKKVLKDAWAHNQHSIIKSKEELLILASIIEKETSVPDERADIAAVFINRLHKKMRLQTDPTVIYAITKGKEHFGRIVYRKDLKIDSPYNTYKIYGLPPGPICNPSKEAIWAAANPSDVDYIYFVASGRGGHLFAKTLSEHNNNVVIYRKNRQK